MLRFTLYSPRPSDASLRACELFDQQWRENGRRTDQMFAVLMIVQWIGGLVAALVISPRGWNGSESYVHPHVWLALYLGAALASLPVYLAWRHPGRTITRHVIALAQIMFSSLLIQVSGGRIETHFHVFGSLAFLAFYRDWRVLVPATLVVAIDHFLRGMFWPQTVFGVISAAPWRWLEHAAWVIFEDLFLLIACAGGVRDMWTSAIRTAELERINVDMKQQTVELQAAYRSNKAIVETALDAVVSMDEQGQITGWNSQAERIFGWTADEVMGQSATKIIIPPRNRASHEAGMRQFFETGESSILNQRLDVAGLHRDGHEFPVELAIAPIRSPGSLKFCAFVRDITARQQAEEALRAAKEAAEAASYAKSAFLANMSHEIRTPLNAILGFTDLLVSQPDIDEEERVDNLKTIADSGRHLLTLINDVLDVSKIESGQMQLDAMPCSPHEILAATVSILRVPAQEKGLTLEYFWKSEIPETICTEPARLRQILMNLVGNAIKFTEVGSVQVAARLQAGDAPKLVIDIIDTGIGIDSTAGTDIFDPFVQADSSITRRFGGTGLGLSISRKLARLLDGDLSMISEKGRGSIFTLTIPTGSLEGVLLTKGIAADILASPLRKESNEASPRLPAYRILLVEDGATNRKLISLVLQRAGVVVHTAENGQLGVEAATAGGFDLILMDMQMPVLDGYTATRRLRQMGCVTPIIALTAHALSGDERKCRDAGCSGYLTKPINANELLAAIQRTVEASGQGGSPRPRSVEATDGRKAPLISRLPMDDPDFCEIIVEFVEQFERKLADVQAAAEQHDFKRVAEIGHWIKGSGGTAGFDELTDPASALERAARERSTADVELQIERLVQILRRIETLTSV